VGSNPSAGSFCYTMKKFLLFFIGILVAGSIVMLIQLPAVTGKGMEEAKKALAETPNIELSGKTLFISDLHLTAEPALDKQFNLNFSNVKNVIIVGDFFHPPGDFASFGDTEEKSLRAVLGEIVPKEFSGKIYSIFGSGHDPALREISSLFFENYEFIYLGEYGKFTIDGVPVAAYHGHQVHAGMIGGGIGWLAEKFGFRLPLEKLGKDRFGIDRDTWVINGHSHVPGIDSAAKVANTGSFVGAPFNKLIFKIHIGTGILFDGDTAELQKYDGLNIKSLYPFVF
jgi:predicted phosphodiesterase